MLLPFVQRTIDGFTPLHLFDAPTQSSGKTYAAQICIAPFREIAPSAYKKNNEENQKELFARLLSGPSHVFTDNITGDLSDPTLATAITEKYLDGRVLGVGRTEVVSTRVVWVGTANNAQLCGDAASRSIFIRLDTGEENPDARQFQFKPVRYIAPKSPASTGRHLYAGARLARSRTATFQKAHSLALRRMGANHRRHLRNHRHRRLSRQSAGKPWPEPTLRHQHGANLCQHGTTRTANNM